MKANELRIGNYIEFDSSARTLVREDEQGFIEVRSIGESGVNEWSDYGASGCVSNPKPIPLTKEWLIKFGLLFGFAHCGSLYDIEYGLDGYDLRLNYDLGMSKYIGSVKHVHQLQNLYFTLTGEELKINDRA
tara:strand:- start:120 stop:515 length:396 start_codon:yes stop_codon:yes gene_type:complete